MKRLAIIILVTFTLAPVLAAQTGPDILRRAMDLRAEIKDYVADVVVTVDMPDVQIPRRTAKVYYRRPDKVAIDSKGIVMIPKEALMLGKMGTEMTRDTSVIILGTKRVNGAPQYTLRVLEKGARRSSDYVLVYVRGDRWTVERMEARSARGLEMAVTWTYQRLQSKYWMPQRLTATIPSRDRSKNKPGTIAVQFNNVRVNTGLSDAKFKEKRK
ncbi:MAG: hypothetical protein ABFE07_14830 [Armatimonadia bacterium]